MNGFGQILDALRAEASKHLLVEAEIDRGGGDPSRIEAGEEFVVHITVSNTSSVWDDTSSPVIFRNVRLHVHGTGASELLTWREGEDPPLLLADALPFGESVATTVRMRATRGPTRAASGAADLVTVRVEGELDLAHLPIVGDVGDTLPTSNQP